MNLSKEAETMFWESLSNLQILGLVFGIICFMVLLHYLRVRLWGERKTKEPEVTVMATIVSKEVKRGTQGSGRSNGGYSYAVNFLTETGKSLELYAYEIEFGALKEGTQGQLTYQGRYFVSFEEK